MTSSLFSLPGSHVISANPEAQFTIFTSVGGSGRSDEKNIIDRKIRRITMPSISILTTNSQINLFTVQGQQIVVNCKNHEPLTIRFAVTVSSSKPLLATHVKSPESVTCAGEIVREWSYEK